ncbi:MAG: hypothetical protein E6344_14465 [Clostridium sp.]|nr:hypothetical protein [Clostridium sp.]MDU7084896.1 hypothetical protein [Clostridium sp.]
MIKFFQMQKAEEMNETDYYHFFNEIMNNEHENIIIVSHGDLLSVFNAMWLGMDIEMLNKCDLFGFAGGVSFMHETVNGKRVIRRMGDMSFIR